MDFGALLSGLVQIISNVISFVFNAIISLINTFMHLVETLLPESPFSNLSDLFDNVPFLGILNYFVPIGAILDIFVLWASVMLVYYVASIVLRWLKVIS